MITCRLTIGLYKFVGHMSLFIDPNNTFEIRLKIRTVDEAGIEFVSEDTVSDDCQEIICRCKGRDFETMSRILEDATIINHITGAPMVRTRNLYRGIICGFVRQWNLVDETSGKPLTITPDVVGQMHDDVPRAIARRWMQKTSGRKS